MCYYDNELGSMEIFDNDNNICNNIYDMVDVDK